MQTKEQIRALKAKKQAELAAAAGAETVKPSSKPSAMPAAPPAALKVDTAAKSLPSDFFEKPTAASSTAAASPKPQLQRAAVARSVVAGGSTTAALPQGFFADKKPGCVDVLWSPGKQASKHACVRVQIADAKARGEKIPDAKDKEDEFQVFQRQMEEQVKEIAKKEADEAAEEADYREEREKHEQRCVLEETEGSAQHEHVAKQALMQMHKMTALTALRKRKAGENDCTEGTGSGTSGVEGTSLANDEQAAPIIVLPARKRRAIDVLQETLAISEDEDDSDDDDIGLTLDWRQKAV
eukprot:364584-Chlamydomonas_euryale.AAC.6